MGRRAPGVSDLISITTRSAHGRSPIRAAVARQQLVRADGSLLRLDCPLDPPSHGPAGLARARRLRPGGESVGSVAVLTTSGDNDPELEPVQSYRHYLYCDACGSFDLVPWEAGDRAQMERRRHWLASDLRPPDCLLQRPRRESTRPDRERRAPPARSQPVPRGQDRRAGAGRAPEPATMTRPRERHSKKPGP